MSKLCVICNVPFTSPNPEVVTCSKSCYGKHYRILNGMIFQKEQRNCLNCGTEFTATKKNHTTCSVKCRQKIGNQKLVTEKNAKAIAGIEHEVPACIVCGYKSRALHSHVLNAHGLTVNQYKEQFNVDDSALYHHSYTAELSERATGENNPGYQHGGKLSSLSKNFVRYSDLDESEVEEKRYEIAKKIADTREANGTNTTRLQYYLNNGMSLQEAEDALSLRQTTFSLEKCIEKYGEQTGYEIWSARQLKWHSNFKKSNYSKISQVLFWGIVDKLCAYESDDDSNTDRRFWFATCIDNGINNEKSLVTKNNTIIKPDFFDSSTNTIIEFYGDYWHGEARGNQARDAAREKEILDSGYNLIIVIERDFRADKQKIIQQCVDKINELTKNT